MIAKYLKIAPLFLSMALCAQESTFSRIRRGNRRVNAKTVRAHTANQSAQQVMTPQLTNGDEARYADKRASYGKALLQLDSGLISPTAFNQMVAALQIGTSNAFLNITMGTNPVERRLVDPQAGFAFNFAGADGWINILPPAPTLESAESAGEMVEDYWMALLRDLPFNEYATAATDDAITDLNNLSNFKGPKDPTTGLVTPATLFRGTLAGDLTGIYISQFLYLPVPIGPVDNFDGGVGGDPGIDFQAQVVPETTIANDFMTTVPDWMAIQRGEFPIPTISFTTDRLFIRNGRDLASFVKYCYPQQDALHAGLILWNLVGTVGSAVLDPNNPYINNPTQEAFTTYALPDLIYLISIAVEYGLRATWYQKWAVHRRIRPEFYGYLVHQQVTGAANYSINSELLNSLVLPEVFGIYGTYLLPQAYPEGSPTHPSYPEGHSTAVGAGVTILKAFFNEDYDITSIAFQPNATNDALEAYSGPAITVGGELNKLASNIGLGRDFAGVHYRSDSIQGMLLGEKIAIAILENEGFMRNISFRGFHLTKFDGTKIIIGQKQTAPAIN